MKIVTAAEMREIDRITSEKYGVPSLTLMENAGAAVAEFILREYPEAKSIGVICGKGNNGGDGFVCARKLHEAGKQVSVLLLADPAEVKGDAAEMFKKLPVEPVLARNEEELQTAAAQQVYDCDVLVDAILGTGFKPPVEGVYKGALVRIAQAGRPVVSIDIPSGADADAFGHVFGARHAVHADAVVTFTAPRPAHIFAGLEQGRVVALDIGSPREAVTSKLKLEVIVPDELGAFLFARPNDAHKGDFGHVLVIGGSIGKAGAAAMAGMAALRVGAGLVTVACPRSVLATVAGFAPELMTEPLDETDAGTISLRALDFGRMDKLVEAKSVLALGPGISHHPDTAEFVRAIVNKYDLPIVLDADGLNAFAGHTDKLPPRGARLVLTPHPGEMARLTGVSTDDIQKDRIAAARRFATERNLAVVLKGHRTLVAEPSGRVWVNTTGNPGMATAGTGDILTGVIASTIAQDRGASGIMLSGDEMPDPELKRMYAEVRDELQGALKEQFRRLEAGETARELDEVLSAKAKTYQAAVTAKTLPLMEEWMQHQPVMQLLSAVYLHGLAGDIARDHLGEDSLIATDLLKYLPDAFRRLREQAGDKFVRIA